MWTEILNERFCVTHVGEYRTIVVMDDVSDAEVRKVVSMLEKRKMVKEINDALDYAASECNIQRSEHVRNVGEKMANLRD